MIDSHCHLDHEPLFNNLDDILTRSKSVGIEKLLTICTTFKSFEKIKQLVLRDDIIYGTYGIHPHEVKNDKVNSKLIIDEINSNKKIIGIGETGLDFYYNHSDRNVQIESFDDGLDSAQTVINAITKRSTPLHDELQIRFGGMDNELSDSGEWMSITLAFEVLHYLYLT